MIIAAYFKNNYPRHEWQVYGRRRQSVCDRKCHYRYAFCSSAHRAVGASPLDLPFMAGTNTYGNLAARTDKWPAGAGYELLTSTQDKPLRLYCSWLFGPCHSNRVCVLFCLARWYIKFSIRNFQFTTDKRRTDVGSRKPLHFSRTAGTLRAFIPSWKVCVLYAVLVPHSGLTPNHDGFTFEEHKLNITMHATTNVGVRADSRKK